MESERRAANKKLRLDEIGEVKCQRCLAHRRRARKWLRWFVRLLHVSAPRACLPLLFPPDQPACVATFLDNSVTIPSTGAKGQRGGQTEGGLGGRRQQTEVMAWEEMERRQGFSPVWRDWDEQNVCSCRCWCRPHGAGDSGVISSCRTKERAMAVRAKAQDCWDTAASPPASSSGLQLQIL